MRIKKAIVYTVFEIIVLILTLFITYNIWDNFELEKDAKIAYSYTDKKSLKLNIENNLKPLTTIEDENYEQENNYLKLNISNDDTKTKTYKLYLKVDETSTLNINYLKLLYKNNIQTITDLKQNKKNYYILDASKIKSSMETNEKLYMWLDIRTPNEEQGKTVNFEILIEEV